jgi:hypothetical protein
MAKEAVTGAVETGLSSKLQPWQALFALISYAVGVYGIEDEKALILYGMILTCLGYVMTTNYKHKEAIKEIVAPWLVEQLLNTLSDYLGTPLPPSATGSEYEKTPELEVEATAKELKARLKAQIEALEKVKQAEV